ncbi:MAG: nucleotidyltransferase domain-containing protein [Rhodobacteraceae bacterium]|nr:nucleotidyltransferase domain-containing protein [Paracoccaceae bacterium]MBR9823764.1 nucleotidyltransferase domain-containing protein [Paracoccaceae bacterium]
MSDQQQQIETIAGALAGDERIRGLFLSGSHGNGRADDYSDIDFLIVSPEGASDAVAETFREAVAGCGEIVLWRDRIVRPALINAITADWTRFDAVLLKPDQLGGQSRAALRALIDRDGILDSLPEGGGPARDMPPARLAYLIDEFIRVLGLLHLVAGRKEYLNGVTGWFLLRGQLIDLMIEETGAPDRGGALHLNRLISPAQQAELAALPLPAPDLASLVAAHEAIAAAFLPRARALAAERGVPWPAAFEEATWQRLARAGLMQRP